MPLPLRPIAIPLRWSGGRDDVSAFLVLGPFGQTLRKDAGCRPGAYETKLEKTRAFLRPDSRVLEFGCGTGSTAILHAPMRRISLPSTTQPGCSTSPAKASAAGVRNLSFVQATLAELASPAGSWDVVLGMSILHLVPDRAATLARVHELLKPGAVFISSTICIGDASWLMRVLAPVFAHCRSCPAFRHSP